MKSMFQRRKLMNDKGQLQGLGLAFTIISSLIFLVLLVIIGLAIFSALRTSSLFAANSIEANATTNITLALTNAIQGFFGVFVIIFSVLGVVIVISIILLLLVVYRRASGGGGGGGASV